MVTFFAMVPIVIAYALGYRFDDSWRLRKTGGLYVTSDISGSKIYLDNKLVKTTNLFQGGAFIDNLTPGNYMISVSKENYLPWEKKLNVESQLVSEAKALLIPDKGNAIVSVQGNFFELESSVYDPVLLFSEKKGNENIVRWFLPNEKEFLTDIGQLVKYNKTFEVVRWLPRGVVLALDGKGKRIEFDLGAKTAAIIGMGNESSLKSEEEKRAIGERLDDRRFVSTSYTESEKILRVLWLENTIYPYYFSGPEEILIRDKKIRNFEFYPGRSDALIAAYDNGIWAIEIDGRGGRNIQPIYKGSEPEFIISNNFDDIFVLDAGNLIEIKLILE